MFLLLVSGRVYVLQPWLYRAVGSSSPLARLKRMLHPKLYMYLRFYQVLKSKNHLRGLGAKSNLKISLKLTARNSKRIPWKTFCPFLSWGVKNGLNIQVQIVFALPEIREGGLPPWLSCLSRWRLVLKRRSFRLIHHCSCDSCGLVFAGFPGEFDGKKSARFFGKGKLGSEKNSQLGG